MILAIAMILLATSSTPGDPLEVVIGHEGRFALRHDGRALEARAADDDAPFVVRIADVAETDIGRLYDLRFIGARPGRYDLADGLRFADGSDATGLEPMPIRITSVLEADHTGDLEELVPPPRPTSHRVTSWFGLAALVWAVPAAVWAWRRRSAQRDTRPHDVVEVEGPTLADQLAPLVAAAAQRTLSPEGKARLERLLIAHWRASPERPPHESHVATLRRLRDEPGAGPLLRGVERWLHAPPDATAAADVDDLLAPFARTRAVLDEEPV